MTRIRDIRSAMAEIRSEDPRSAITERALRRIVVDGEIPSRRVGSGKRARYLFDMDAVWLYFSGEDLDGDQDV